MSKLRTLMALFGCCAIFALPGCTEPEDTMYYQTEDAGPEEPADSKLQEQALPEWEEKNPDKLDDTPR